MSNRLTQYSSSSNSESHTSPKGESYQTGLSALTETFQRIKAIESQFERQFALLHWAKPHSLTKPEMKRLYDSWLTEQEG